MEKQELERKEVSGRNRKKDIDHMSNLDLNLNLSPPVLGQLIVTTTTNPSTPSPTSSCVSSEMSCLGNDNGSNAEETIVVLSEMVLVGCIPCHIYVLLAKDNMRCPKCNHSDFIHIPDFSTKSNKKSRKN
ncbi:hypothetical protein MKW94_025356 [Papaver nudicaule]|uniref:GIR1-like zinc ribbon domain-containing protein n=1 Tax=Papaver nudicaule TaxID=74823 RepID=A0AA41VXM6_PAPNU|nr:hypothetical protein [Papaver nudicaule]